MKKSYLEPKIKLLEDLNLLSLAQSGLQLTGLESCNQEPCPSMDHEYHMLGYNMCAEGISDASLLNDAAYTMILSCPSGQQESYEDFSNCRVNNDISCPAGTLAVTCDIEVHCALSDAICDTVNTGVTDNSQFVECPGFKKDI